MRLKTGSEADGKMCPDSQLQKNKIREGKQPVS